MKKAKILKGIFASVIGCALLTSSVCQIKLSAEAESGDDVDINFAKALQMSLYFYDANKCGSGITNGNLEWRGDCHTEDEAIPLIPMGEDFKGTNLNQDFIDEYRDILDSDGDGTIDCSGGMHDAGDHVKFGLPGSYAASTLGWGYYEFRDAYQKTGTQEHAEDILHWFNDFYMKSTYLDENGKVIAFCYQVGEGNIDHNYWIAPELQNETSLQDFARPAYFATSETPASDMCAGTAASLAVNYLNFKDTDPAYAEESLKKAVALYDFAVETHAENGIDSCGYDGGFYTSSYDFDELAWAAVWLYECTGNWDYIDDIIKVDESNPGDMGALKYTGYLQRIIADTGNCWQNIWVHCWDTVWGGVFAKLAPITNTARDWYIFRWNLEYWSGIEHQDPGQDDKLWNTAFNPKTDTLPVDKSDGTFLKKTDAGFSMLNNYGSARYDTAAGLCAMVYGKETGDMRFADWAEGQMEYIMGKNPMNRSYIVGYSENGASHPHHRASHGSKTLNMDDPIDQTHVLWGALVGGPDEDDFHNDVTKDYIYNEVAVDYNAGFVGACAGLYKYYGEDLENKPLDNFPPSEKEMKGDIEEFTIEAKSATDQENSQRSQITVNVNADTSLPPRYVDNLKVRYFFNIEELFEYGQDINDFEFEVYYDENDARYGKAAEVTGPFEWDGKGTYYIEINWKDCAVFGTRELQFAMVVGMDDNFLTHWEPLNDFSRNGLIDDYTDTQYIPVYEGDLLVYGEEPPGRIILKGDVNDDKTVDTADLVMLSQYIIKKSTSVTRADNADIDDNSSLNIYDQMLIRRMLV